LFQLWRTNNKNDLGTTMLQDVGGAFGGFVEIDRNGDGAGTVDGEVGSVPLRTVGGKETDAVAGLYSEFDKRGGKAGDAAKEFLGGDGLPVAVAPNHLGTRVRKIVNGVEEARRKRAVVHGRRSL